MKRLMIKSVGFVDAKQKAGLFIRALLEDTSSRERFEVIRAGECLFHTADIKEHREMLKVIKQQDSLQGNYCN